MWVSAYEETHNVRHHRKTGTSFKQIRMSTFIDVHYIRENLKKKESCNHNSFMEMT